MELKVLEGKRQYSGKSITVSRPHGLNCHVKPCCPEKNLFLYFPFKPEDKALQTLGAEQTWKVQGAFFLGVRACTCLDNCLRLAVIRKIFSMVLLLLNRGLGGCVYMSC